MDKKSVEVENNLELLPQIYNEIKLDKQKVVLQVHQSNLAILDSDGDDLKIVETIKSSLGTNYSSKVHTFRE